MSPADTAQTIEHPIGETGSLSVRLADWDVEVIAVDGDVARIRNAEGATLPDGLEIQRNDNGLAIRQPNRSALDVLSVRRSPATRISVEIPTRATASIQTASGDIQATGLRGPVESRTASGDVLLVDVAGEVQVETVSGDVAIRLAGRTTLAVRTVSGDCIIEGGEVDRFAYTTTSGDMRMTSELGDGPHAIATVSGDAIVTTRNGIRISAQTVTGDLGSDLPHTSEGRPGRRSLVIGEGSTVVQFRSVSGDLRVVGPNGAQHLKAIPRPPTTPAPPAPPAPPPLPRPRRSLPPHRRRTPGPNPTRVPTPVSRPRSSPMSRLTRSLRPPASTSSARSNAARWTSRRRRPSSRRWTARPMADPLDEVLRLVAEGWLTPEEAAPVIDALQGAGMARRGRRQRQLRRCQRGRRRRCGGSTGRDEPAPRASPRGLGGRPEGRQPPRPDRARPDGHRSHPRPLGRQRLQIRQALDEGMTGPILAVDEDDEGNGVRIVLE